MRKKSGLVVAGALLALAQAAAGQVYETNLDLDHRAIRYWDVPLADPVTKLAARLERGDIELTFRPEGQGYLQALLRALGVSAESQVLVFSKTGLQRARISPRTPRAIYFNDDVAIAFVPGANVIELAAIDPLRGAVFYTMSAAKRGLPRFERSKLCLACHHDAATLGVAGIYVGSVYVSPTGRPDYRGSIVSDHRTPFEDRWGGWFVSGRGAEPHRGNTVSSSPAGGAPAGVRLPLNMSSYLSPSSDLVALMTLEHQTHMTNLLIRLGWEARMKLEDSVVDARIEEVASYMLFEDEVPLAEPVQGASSFAATFSQKGPRDRKGRSLRELDLKTRLFRFPLSYMIYSDLFDALPERVRDRLYARLLVKMAASDEHAASAEILRATKVNLPGF
jgi:hypothetical protein